MIFGVDFPYIHHISYKEVRSGPLNPYSLPYGKLETALSGFEVVVLINQPRLNCFRQGIYTKPRNNLYQSKREIYSSGETFVVAETFSQFVHVCTTFGGSESPQEGK